MSAAGLLAASHGVTTAQDVSMGHVLLQMVVALAIVIGGIWGFGKIMRRSPRGRRPGGPGRGRVLEHGLRVLSRQAVGKGKSIAVVQAGDQCFLVGIADSGLTPLGELKRSSRAHHAEGAEASALEAAQGGEEQRTGAGDLSLAPFDLGSLDLASLAGAVAGAGDAPVRVSGGGRSGPSGPPTARGWLDALREATVRR